MIISYLNNINVAFFSPHFDNGFNTLKPPFFLLVISKFTSDRRSKSRSCRGGH